jgi:DNA-binding transcriptional MerR regulator
MDQPLLTIGAFARAVGLAPSALRYYDECGLLHPAEVDETTGYRYYTPDLARRAQLVAQMRDAGVSIEVMRAALDGTAEDRRRVLGEVLAQQEALAARRAAVLEELLAEEVRERPATTLTVDGPELAAAIRQVRAAADADPASPLSGVLLDVYAGTLDVVATNRYWMAVRTLACSPADDIRVVVTLPDAAGLCDLLARHDRATVDLRTDHIEVAAQRLPVRDVAYPAHRMLLDGLPPATIRVVLPRAELLEAIAAAGRAEVDLDVTPDAIRLGDREVAGVVDGSGASLRLGSALARRAIESALGPEIVLRIGAETSPVRVASPYQPGYLALLMPIARTQR